MVGRLDGRCWWVDPGKRATGVRSSSGASLAGAGRLSEGDLGLWRSGEQACDSAHR